MSESSLGTTIIKYEKTLSSKPSSLVFAPLSQAYCEMGLYDKAMNVLKKGIRYNPSYVLGYVALAQCYFAQKQFNLAYSTLRPLVTQNRDNIKLQLLFAQVTEATEAFEECLDTYSYLSFLNSSDKKVKEKIKEIKTILKDKESDYEEDEKLVFDIEDISLTSEVEEWEQVSFTEKKTLEEEFIGEDKEDWTPLEVSKPENEKNSESDNSALFTHTLVDLYVKQGHSEKAIDILEKILELRPGEVKTLEKLSFLKDSLVNVDEVPQQEEYIGEGHNDLMATFDKLEKVPEDEVSSTSTISHEEISDPLLDFQNALLIKGRDKALQKK